MALDNLLAGIQVEADILQVGTLVVDTPVADIHAEDILAGHTHTEDIPGEGMHQVEVGIHVDDILQLAHVQGVREILCRLCLIHHACPSHHPFFTLENKQACLISVQIKER